MQMKRFRVQNYKKVEDTDWVKCDNLTVFVGKNESGKSAIFRGLSKLNPSDGEIYDALKEFPRRRYSEYKNRIWPVSSAEFELEKNEIEKLCEICDPLRKIKSVIVTRFYDDSLKAEFEPKPDIDSLLVKDYLNSIKSWKKQIEKTVAPEGKGEILGQIKNNFNQVFDSTIAKLTDEDELSSVDSTIVKEVTDTLNSNINEEWQQKIFDSVIEENDKLSTRIEKRDDLENAKNWIYENIPQFIYFDKYDVLDSAVHIDRFIQDLNEDPHNPKLRITKCLFEHAGLDIDEIQGLDINNEQKAIDELKRISDERGIKMHAASLEMTKKFQDWWEQRKHEFEYRIDGKNFRVWVSDDLDPSRIELDQRSAGMQYFFSFYLIFLVESARAHVNSILLLDEPGLQYHGTAQQKAVEFLEKISTENQLLYTTHSPFMIDGEHLENVRIVYEDENNYGVTKVSDDVWPNDKDSLFPLQVGIGYSVAQTLFYAKKQFVVEGLTDYTLLKAMNELLLKKKMTTLNDDIIITPAGGIKHLLPLASLLLGNKIKMAIMLDSDQAGIQKQEDMKEKLLLDCFLINSATKENHTEIEDLFLEDLYLDAVREAYPDIELDFDDNEKKILGISKRVNELFKRNGKKFQKWLPNNILIEWIRTENSEHVISEKTCRYFESIVNEVNKKLGS